MGNRYEISEQNGMSREFVDWFFDNKKNGCGNVWFMMMAAMWEGWKGNADMQERQSVGHVDKQSLASIQSAPELNSLPNNAGSVPVTLTANELSAILSWMTPPYITSGTHTDEFNELRNKVFYALRDAQNDESVSNRDELPEEKGASLQLRNLIRRRHAEWSDATFGNVGPVGPLKHLSKEALEAAAEPDDLSEWADMQFLLWDAQRRAGICDGEITAAMEEKLKVNMVRQWPEPKDGEPRLHIKEDGNSPVIPDGYALVPIEPTPEMIAAAMDSDDVSFDKKDDTMFYVHHDAIWRAMLAAAPQQEVK